MAPTSRQRFSLAWTLLRRHWRPFVVVELGLVGAWVLLEVAVISLFRLEVPDAVAFPIWGVLHVGFLWGACVLLAGLHAMALLVVDGGTPTWRMAFARVDRGTAYLLASSVYWAAVIVGLCLLVLPGLFVAMRWGLFRWIIAERATPALASLRQAASTSAAHPRPVLRMLLLSVALDLAGAALLGLGLLLAFPVTLIARAIHYRAVQQEGAG
jgi:uncharacterized membrane protein